MEMREKDILSYAKVKDLNGLQKFSAKELATALIDVYEDYNGDKMVDRILDIRSAEVQQDILRDIGSSQAQSDYRSLQDEYEMLKEDYSRMEDEANALKARVAELEEQLAQKIRHQGGRRDKYTPEQRKAIVDFYRRGGETYESTAEHFCISTNTVGRILKEVQ